MFQCDQFMQWINLCAITSHRFVVWQNMTKRKNSLSEWIFSLFVLLWPKLQMAIVGYE